MHFTICEDIIFHAISGELVVFDMRSSEYLGLDETGSDVWRLLADGLDTDDIATNLAARHRADPVVVARDVTAFVDELRAADLIRQLE